MSIDPANPEKDVELLSCPGMDKDWSKWGPAWSPDGRQIAFVVESDRNAKPRQADIGLTNVNETSCRQLTRNSGSNERPTWLLSPMKAAMMIGHRSGCLSLRL